MSTIIFKNRSSKPERIHTEAGSGMATTYGIKMDENGHKTVYEKGVTNIYAKIQESLESTKIENIIKRCGLGDLSGLRTDLKCGDTTTLPKNLMEVQNTIIKLKEDFMELPVEVRAKFDHNADQFVLTYGKKSWEDRMGITEKKQKIKEAQEREKASIAAAAATQGGEENK